MIFFRIVRFLLVLPYRLLFWLKVKGRENIPKEGGVIVCSTHIHLLDPISHAVAQPRPFYSMAKEELFRNKVFGALLSVLGAFPVRRGRRDKSAVEHALKRLDKGKMIILYPEGTRSKTGQPLEFKTGVALIAHYAEVPIIPAVVVAKHGYIPFCGVTIIYGKPVTIEQLGVKNGDSKELRNAALALHDIAAGMLAEEKAI